MKHGKRIFTITAISLFCTGYGNAQLIYFSDAAGILKTVDLSNGTCNVTELGLMYYPNGSDFFIATDIAFHPNGNLYATDGVALYLLDINNQSTQFIGNHGLSSAFVNALVCDSDGVMYAADENLFTININTGQATGLGVLPCPSAGDLAFNNGELYLACLENRLLRVNINAPFASEIIGTMDAVDDFYGIVTFATECSDVETYGTAQGNLYQIDVSNAETTLTCNINGQISVYGAAMETDFVASDCDFSVDLDFDNSSGANMSNFFADTICGNTPSPVADTDLEVIAEGEILSMQIWISTGLLDGAAEYLVLDNANNLQVTGSGTAFLELQATGTVTEANLEAAILNTNYINTAANYTPGLRVVSVLFFAENDQESNVANAFIYLEEPASLSVEFGPQHINMCEGETLVLDAFHPDADFYLWQDGSSDPTLEVTSTGTYSVTISEDCGGTDSDEVVVYFSPPNGSIDLGPDTTLCEGESLILDAFVATAQAYLWQDGSTWPNLTVTESGIYEVSVSLDCGFISDEIEVLYEEIPEADLFTEDTLLCEGASLILDASLPGALSYEWNSGENSPVLNISRPGIYEVTVRFYCEELIETIEVSFSDYDLNVDLGVDTTFCFGDSVLLEAYSVYAENYLWQDGSTEANYTVKATGTYAVTISDACQEASDAVRLEMTSCCYLYVPNAFTPDFDGANDEFLGFANCDFPEYRLKVFNRWGALVFETDNQYLGWDGTFKGKTAEIGVYVWFIEYFDGLENQVESGDVTLLR